MRIVFQQADLDTCLTALLVGVGDDELRAVTGDASPDDLADPSVVCIEAGGSGRTDLGNFDHHGIGAPVEPACVQALAALAHVAEPSDHLRRLVRYVADVDGGRLGAPPLVTEHVMTLSSVFSGMRLCTPEPVAQLRAGLTILREVLRRDFNPAGPLPELPEWRTYFERKRQEWNGISSVRGRIDRFITAGRIQAGFLETDFVGALGLLYDEGCEVAIAYSPRYQSPSGIGPVPKYSIGCRAGLRVDGLLAALTALEIGWGGPSHGTIIGSPRTGTGLSPEQIRRIVISGS